MSGRFDFHSGGAAATGALEQFLAEQENRKRQQMLDSITQQNAQSQQEDRLANRKIQEEQIKVSQQGRDQAANKELFDQSKDIVDMAGPNDTVDAPTVLKLQKAGFGGRVQTLANMGTPGIGVMQPEDLPPDAHVTTEGPSVLQPGKAWEMARQGAAEKTAAAAQAATERQTAEQTRADEKAAEAAQRSADKTDSDNKHNQTLIALKTMDLGGKASATAEKNAEKQKTTDLARTAQINGANDTLNALSALHDKVDPTKLAPDMQSIVGAWGGKLPDMLTPPGSDIANARSRLKEVRARLDVGLLNELKNQSRTGATGFGQLSANELAIIEAASGRLDSAQSPEQFMSALNDIETRVKRILLEPGSGPSKAGDKVSMTPHGESAAPTGTTPRTMKYVRNPTTHMLELVP